MKTYHESFLRPFFEEMNKSFPEQWCVLHSYELLPFYSESDVDMAFSSNKVKVLEELIIVVAKKTGWYVYQKLWYDVKQCFYYVLKRNTDDTELAIDFLIDNDGIGRYGFKTSLLTDKCEKFNKLIPIPNSSVAFSYKLIKRIIKQLDLSEDIEYLLVHFEKGDYSKIKSILYEQYGSDGWVILKPQLKNKNFLISKNNMKQLVFLRKKQTLKSVYWESKRIMNRIVNPCGILINIPELTSNQLANFKNKIEKKLGLLFRFVICNSENLPMLDFKGLVGSTLVIRIQKNFNPKKAIKTHWLDPRYKGVIINDTFDTDYLVDIYYEKILDAIKKRNRFKGQSGNEL